MKKFILLFALLLAGCGDRITKVVIVPVGVLDSGRVAPDTCALKGKCGQRR